MTTIEQTMTELRGLFANLAESPLGMTTAWECAASNGKPLLYGGKRGLLAYGTIATWNEFDFIAAIVNAFPAIDAAFKAKDERAVAVDAEYAIDYSAHNLLKLQFGQIEAERDTLAAEVERLREALHYVEDFVQSTDENPIVVDATISIIRAAITPEKPDAK